MERYGSLASPVVDGSSKIFGRLGFRSVWASPGHQKGEQWKKDLGCLGYVIVAYRG